MAGSDIVVIFHENSILLHSKVVLKKNIVPLLQLGILSANFLLCTIINTSSGHNSLASAQLIPVPNSAVFSDSDNPLSPILSPLTSIISEPSSIISEPSSIISEPPSIRESNSNSSIISSFQSTTYNRSITGSFTIEDLIVQEAFDQEPVSDEPMYDNEPLPPPEPVLQIPTTREEEIARTVELPNPFRLNSQNDLPKTLRKINMKDLKINNTLAQGGQGVVILAEWKSMKVVIKKLNMTSVPTDAERTIFKRELAAWKYVNFKSDQTATNVSSQGCNT